MIIFRSIFSIFFSFDTQLTHLNAPTLLNFDSSDRFLPIASQSWCSGVSKMATYIYIYRAALYVVRLYGLLPTLLKEFQHAFCINFQPPVRDSEHKYFII